MILRHVHQTLRRITDDFDSRWHFNTSIAAIMELVNEMYLEEARLSPAAMGQTIQILTLMLAPFAPHLAQELWEEQGGAGPVFKQTWPDFDPDLARESEVEIVVQINGKVRARLIVPAGTDAQGLTSMAEDDDKIQALVEGKTVVKVIAVPDKLINLVVK
jgi:leucyl-tRNA synthetase